MHQDKGPGKVARTGPRAVARLFCLGLSGRALLLLPVVHLVEEARVPFQLRADSYSGLQIGEVQSNEI